MKKGLIPEGGAMQGMFTAGVPDVLMERRHGQCNETLDYIRKREAEVKAFLAD